MKQLEVKQIIGSWSLDSFEIENLEEKLSPWGRAANGLLIYADTGHMSVSINKADEKDSENEFESLFDSILFYSGTYEIDRDRILHHVTNASNPSRIGKEMIRFAEFDNNVMTLVTPKESFGRAILKWRKIK